MYIRALKGFKLVVIIVSKLLKTDTESWAYGCVPQVRVKGEEDFPGGAVVKNLPASAGDTGLSPGPGRSHMPRSN